VVDDLLGQQQVVVKSVEANYDSIDGIGGATILGSGRVALIIDVSHLRESQNQATPRRSERPVMADFVHSAPGTQ
jgi:two-component system chemotaxis sensor kinase CheA